MRYHWDEKDFLRAVNKLKKVTDRETDLTKKFYYKQYLDIINSAYFVAFPKVTSIISKVDDNETLINLTSAHLSNGRYVSIIKDFYNSLLSLEKEMDLIDDAIEAKQQEDKTFSLMKAPYFKHEDALRICKSFYEEFDLELYNYFNKIYTDRYHSIRFTKMKALLNSKLNTEGSCIFIDGIQKNFITVENNKGLRKLSDLIHETGHGICNFLNPQSNINNNDGFFAEVEGIFPEMVAGYDVLAKINQTEYLYLEYCNLAVMFDIAKGICLQDIFVKEWQKNDYSADKDYFKKLRQKRKIFRPLFEACCEYDLYEHGTYVMSYMLALELFHIYKEDKEKALKLFKDFIRLAKEKDDLLEAYLIGLNNNATEEANNIINKIKLELNMTGVKI